MVYKYIYWDPSNYVAALLNVVKAGYGAFLSFFKEKSYSFFLLVDKDDRLSS